jgi:hypothetical protein
LRTSADAQPALPGRLDPVHAGAVDVDQMGRRLDLQLHQVEQIGAAGDEARALMLGRGAGRLGRIGGSYIGEGLHAFSLPATSRIAATMFG